jgi:hypothetical protein
MVNTNSEHELSSTPNTARVWDTEDGVFRDLGVAHAITSCAAKIVGGSVPDRSLLDLANQSPPAV